MVQQESSSNLSDISSVWNQDISFRLSIDLSR